MQNHFAFQIVSFGPSKPIAFHLWHCKQTFVIDNSVHINLAARMHGLNWIILLQKFTLISKPVFNYRVFTIMVIITTIMLILSGNKITGANNKYLKLPLWMHSSFNFAPHLFAKARATAPVEERNNWVIYIL